MGATPCSSPPSAGVKRPPARIAAVAKLGASILTADLARLADEEHMSLSLVLHRRGENPRRFVEAWHRGPAAEGRGLERTAQLRAREQRSGFLEGWARLEHATAGVDQLGVTLTLLEEPDASRRADARPGLLDENCDVLRPDLQLLVNRKVKVLAQADIQDAPSKDQHDRHRDGERRRDPYPNRRAVHAPLSVRNRYPAPRTVSSEARPNGRSILRRRWRM